MSAPHDHTHTDTHGHAHDHNHDHDHGHGHSHDHDHEHEHGHGFLGALKEFFVPHTHDSSDSIDDALEASSEGVRALKISLFVLIGTTVLQFAVVLISGGTFGLGPLETTVSTNVVVAIRVGVFQGALGAGRIGGHDGLSRFKGVGKGKRITDQAIPRRD